MGQKMRMVCPECAAQYEVDASVIPQAGRDVQCSNCDHTWWQMPTGGASMRSEGPRHKARNTPERPDPIAEEMIGGEAPAAVAEAAMPPAAKVEPAEIPEAGDADLNKIGAPASDAQRRTLDEAVLNVLRQEAERESQARQAERGTGESPGGLGPDSALGRGEGEREAAVHDRMEAMRSQSGEDVSGAGSRLPNIDEINSSLHGRGRVETAPSDAGSSKTRGQRTGFRLGFTLSVAAAIAVIAAYVFSDRIVQSAPELEASMAAFTRSVDSGRVWLDTAALNATMAIQGMTQGDK